MKPKMFRLMIGRMFSETKDVQTKNESSFQALKPISGPQARCKDPGSSILSSGNALRAELEPVSF